MDGIKIIGRNLINIDGNTDFRQDDIFNTHFVDFIKQFQQSNILPINMTESFETVAIATTTPSLKLAEISTGLIVNATTSLINSTLSVYMDILLAEKDYEVINSYKMNCSPLHSSLYSQAAESLKIFSTILTNITYLIIITGIIFNIINLIVLLKSKLNESPYSYLTILAISDLGTLVMVIVEKLRQKLPQNDAVRDFHLIVMTILNIFQSCSIYITLALTIERFIFVHSPFKAMTICRRSIARRVCLIIFIFSVLRCSYLPFMYVPNCSNGHSQKKNKLIDLYEFLIGLAIPYLIIFIANISLIRSLNKQNNLMNIPLSFSFNSSNQNNSSILNATAIVPVLVTKKVKSSLSNNSIAKQADQAPKQSPKTRALFKSKLLKYNSTDVGTLHEDESLLQKKRHALEKFNKMSKINRQRSTASLKVIEESSSKKLFKKLKHSNTFNSFNKSIASSITTNTINSNGTATENGSMRKTTILYHRTSNQREMRNQKKLTTTLIIILCLLLICYLPSFLFEESLADAIFGSHESPITDEAIRAYKIKLIGSRISIFFIYLNCSCNFLIYCFCNKKFKNSLKALIKKSILNKIYQQTICFISKNCILFYKKKKANRSNNEMRFDGVEMNIMDNQNQTNLNLNKMNDTSRNIDIDAVGKNCTIVKKKLSIKTLLNHKNMLLKKDNISRVQI